MFEWCRVELPLNSASIRRPFVVHFPSKCNSGASDKMSSTVIFAFLKKDGNQNEQQNPKCKQFLLVATRQAPENHGGTLCCVLPPPNPVVLFPLGRQGAPRYLGVQNLGPIFGLESVGHGGSLQHVFSGVLAICVETERDTSAGRMPNHASSAGVGRGVFGEKRMHEGESGQS